MSTKENKDEIDLLEIAVKTVHFLLTNWLIIVFFSLLPPTVMFVLKKLERPVYEAQLTIRFVDVTTEEISKVFGQYERSGLSGAGNIKSLSLEVYSSKNRRTDFVYTDVRCTTEDTTQLSVVEKSVLDYLEKQEFLVDYNKERQANAKKLLAQYNDKLEKAQTILDASKDVASMELPELMELYRRKTEIESDLNSPLYKVILPFTPTLKNTFAPKPLIFSGVLGFVLALTLLFVRFFVSHYKKVTRQIA